MNKFLIVALTGTAVLFASCKSLKKSSVSAEQINSKTTMTDIKWKLIELQGQPIADSINGKIPFIMLQAADSSYAASAGCNGLGGKYTLYPNGRIRFSQGVSTMMACNQMEIETNFRKMLGQVDSYRVNGDTLSFNKGRMSRLAQFVAIKEDVTRKELDGTWELDYITGPRIAFSGLYPNKKPTMTFNLDNSTYQGNSSCNNYNGTFKIDGSKIKFNDPSATLMACPGNGEAVFFKTLKMINKYNISNNGTTLNLIMGDIAVMRLQRK